MTRSTSRLRLRAHAWRSRPLAGALECLEDRRVLAAPGSLDPTVNGGVGYVQTSITSVFDQQFAVATNAANQVIGVGRNWKTGSPPQHRDAAIAKFNVDGSLDTTFGDAGKVIASFGSFEQDSVSTRINVLWDVAIDHNNMIVVAGETGVGSGTGFVARYDQNGNPDTTFGGTGVVFLPPRYLSSLAIDSQNRVVVLGYSYEVDPETAIAGPDYLFIARLTATGGVDFQITNSFGDEAQAYDLRSEVAVDSQDRILAIGISDNDESFVTRYLATGTIDTSFGTSGMKFAHAEDTYRGITTDANDNVLVTGYAPIPGEPGKQVVTTRFKSADGAFDTSFDADGRATTTIPGQSIGGSEGHSIEVDADGKIIIGATAAGAGTGVIRYLTDGTFDPTFGTSGIATARPGNGGSKGMAIDAAGRVVIGSESFDGFGFARFLTSNAAPNLTLSGSLTYTENAPPAVLAGAAVVTDSDNANFDGGALTVGITANANANDRLAIRNQGTGADQISIDNGNVVFNGQVIGTHSGGDGTPLVVMLNSNATVAATQALVRNITFTTLGHAPSTATRTVSLQLTDGDGGTSPSRTRQVNVTAVNDAPVLNTALIPALTSIAEDAFNNPGTLVSTLVATAVTDPDGPGAIKGIAVSSANNTAGTWQYTLDGTNWLNFGAVSRGAVRLLPANATTRVRLVPKADFNGTASIWFFAWDQTSGTPGGTANLTPAGTTGGTTAFSTVVGQAFLSVTPVNDAPKLNTGVAVNLNPIAEDTPAASNAGTLVSSLLGGITDVDAGALKGIAVSSANNTPGTWQYTLDGTNWQNFGTVSRGAVRLLPANATARVRLLPKANFNGTASLWFFAWDQTSGTPGSTANLTPAGTTGGTTAFSTNARQAFLSVTPVNDAPKLNTGVAVNLDPIAEDSTPAGTLVSSLLGGITDVDAGALKGIAVSSANNTAGTWQYTLDGTNWLNFGAVSRGAVRLLPANATTRVRLLPNADFNGTTSLWFFAWDQTSGTPGGTADLNPVGTTGGTTAFSTSVRQAFLSVTPVNDAPVLGGISGTIGYTLGNSAVIVASAATVSDVDSANFDTGELRVRITDGASAANQLELSGFTIGAGNAVMQGTTQVGTRTSDGLNGNELRITLNANATKAVVQQLVRSVTFRATSTTGSRSLLFSVSDGDGHLSDELTKAVNVT